MNRMVVVLVAAVFAAGCAHEPEQHAAAGEPVPAGSWYTVASAERVSTLSAAGVAEPLAEATLSTKLMGAVTAVHVQEGDRVRAGEVIAEIDARDLQAKAAQVQAGIAEAEAMQREAATHAQRMRALFAEDAAPRAQLDAAETGLARAEAAVRSAHAGARELAAVSSYARVTSPFSGTVIRRMVDAGAFASPGAPLVTVQDASRLRISVTVAPSAVRGLARGAQVSALVEDVPVTAVVEGVVPAGGSLYTVNALVENGAGLLLPGSAATLALPQGTRTSIVVPLAALRREGDLTGVHVKSGEGAELRWVRVGGIVADSIEVLSGLRPGEQVRVPEVR